jgi:hypothetical protein
MSSGSPSPSCPNPNNGDKGKGKDKGKEKGKNNSFSGSDNNNDDNSRGTLVWPSFYNPWTGTISMWPGMCHPQHSLLAAPMYYRAPGGPSFTPLPGAPFAHPPLLIFIHHCR